jgi:hypothetical protein
MTDKQLDTLFHHSLSIAQKSYWSRIGLILFKAIYHTGLRPCELTTAFLIPEKTPAGTKRYILEVKNAKNTHGRSHGETRHLYLDNYSDEAIEDIRNAIAIARLRRSATGKPLSPERFIKYASRGFSKLTRQLFPRAQKIFVLYTARHLFAANLKFMGYKPWTIAALMGHGVDSTAFRHYARATSGRHGMQPISMACEEARVKRKHVTFDQTMLTSKQQSSSRFRP